METFVHQGVEYQLPTAEGLVFRSTAAAYQLIVRARTPIYDHGILIGEEKELVADFGDQNAPEFYDEEGEAHVNIRGHYCHTLEQARQKGWTDDERTLVEKKLLVSQLPNIHWLHTQPKPGKPWPTYDTTHHFKIPKLADELGLVQEAIAYEKATKNRDGVLAALSEVGAVTVGAPAAGAEAEELAAA